MQQINITQKINEAEGLIMILKPNLEIYGTFNYEIILKGKEDPKFFLQITCKNVFTSIVTKEIFNITKRNFFFTLGLIEGKTEIILNIII